MVNSESNISSADKRKVNPVNVRKTSSIMRNDNNIKFKAFALRDLQESKIATLASTCNRQGL